MELDVPYLNIHTHCTRTEEGVISLRNVIVSRDRMSDSPCSVGIHPWYVDADEQQQYAVLERYARERQVLAIGECGLDKVISTPWEMQLAVFRHQIALAELLRKPLIIHCVRAYQETLHALKQVSVPVVFHGFNKKIELASQIVRQGHYLSMGVSILKGRLDEHILHLPLDKIFLETDDKSVAIMDVYAYFCAVRKMPLLQLKQQMAHNFEGVFKYRILQ